MNKYKKIFLIILIFSIILGIKHLSYGKQKSKNLNIIFSNNINAETDPCPT